MTKNKFIIGANDISYKEIISAVENCYIAELSSETNFIQRLKKSRDVLESKLAKGETVYGVTTGYGDSCSVDIPKELQSQLPLQLSRYHQCGLGKNFSPIISKTIQLIRIISLSRGYSAVRVELLEHMVNIYNKGIVPRIPEEGSVGASGDLTPLAYYAAVLQGEGDVILSDGSITPTLEEFERKGIKPIQLVEKEALALMNGTAVMTAVACHVFSKSDYLVDLSSQLTAGCSMALLANSKHFHKVLFEAKPHQGSIYVAQKIRNALSDAEHGKELTRLQDRYSIRCAPHIIGVLKDGINQFESLLNIEINSANDNPLVGVEEGEVYHGGNFYGGHISFIMDGLKNLVANLSDLMDRQMALLVDTKFNNGLPSNLSAAQGDDRFLAHGLKALQISVSAWTAEALKLTMPASVFSRSTECHNQDKVSMGTISARDAMRVLELTEQVAAALIMAVNQGIKLRLSSGELHRDHLGCSIMEFCAFAETLFEFVTVDRALEQDLRKVLLQINLKAKDLIR